VNEGRREMRRLEGKYYNEGRKRRRGDPSTG
jgi:hypothetical protein